MEWEANGGPAPLGGTRVEQPGVVSGELLLADGRVGFDGPGLLTIAEGAPEQEGWTRGALQGEDGGSIVACLSRPSGGHVPWPDVVAWGAHGTSAISSRVASLESLAWVDLPLGDERSLRRALWRAETPSGAASGWVETVRVRSPGRVRPRA